MRMNSIQGRPVAAATDRAVCHRRRLRRLSLCGPPLP